MINTALEYLEKYGFSIIPMQYIPPVNGDPKGKKVPKLKEWKKYQTQRPTSEQVKLWWSNWPNAMIGVLTGKLSGIISIDIDEEVGFEIINKLIPDSLIMPTYKTPSGGQQMIFKMPNFDLRNAVRNLPGCDLRAEGGIALMPPSFNEVGKYQWIDNLSIKQVSIPELPQQYIDIIKARFKEHTTSVVNSTTSNYIYYKILQQGTRNDDLFRVSNSLIRANAGEYFTRQVLEILAKNSNPPFDGNELETVIRSALERSERKERNLTDEVREYILLQKDYITVTNILQMLHLTTKEEKKHLTVIIHRLQEKGIIEKYGNTPGSYRIKNKTITKIDWEEEEEEREFHVKLPLELNRMCKIPPGSIIIAAGSKSSGKTALLLNIAMANQYDYECDYLNSEMHKVEFKGRVKKFGGDIKKCKINAYNCFQNFHDYIIDSGSPKIYFIDFLEIHDKFFEIAKPIRQIHEKLGDSICFIGLQMKGGGELGRGDAFSAEKARLYLTMDYQVKERATKITIYDAKIPRDENVRGQWRMVKIIDGHKLSPQGNWRW